MPSEKKAIALESTLRYPVSDQLARGHLVSDQLASGHLVSDQLASGHLVRTSLRVDTL
jgi:hypothetical protein